LVAFDPDIAPCALINPPETTLPAIPNPPATVRAPVDVDVLAVVAVILTTPAEDIVSLSVIVAADISLVLTSAKLLVASIIGLPVFDTSFVLLLACFTNPRSDVTAITELSPDRYIFVAPMMLPPTNRLSDIPTPPDTTKVALVVDEAVDEGVILALSTKEVLVLELPEIPV
jgi:hypothetical protein